MAQPLAAVAAAVSKVSLDALGLCPDQLKVVCKRAPYQLQLRVAQASIYRVAFACFAAECLWWLTRHNPAALRCLGKQIAAANGAKISLVVAHSEVQRYFLTSCHLYAQVDKPIVVISLKFIQGGITFVALNAVPSVHQTHSASLTTTSISQQASLPKKLQAVFKQVHVYLPRGVSKADAASSQYFDLAQRHRMSAGFWTQSSNLTSVLQLLMQ